MEGLPEIVPATRVDVALVRPPLWNDHHVSGRPVLAAVEAMEHLAQTARSHFPALDVTRMGPARFEKFLYLDAPAGEIAVQCGFVRPAGQPLQARLETRKRARSAGFTRRLIHADVGFDPPGRRIAPPPLDLAAAVAGVCIRVASEAVHRQLVPFGPGYHNIVAPLVLSSEGALATVGSPRSGDRRRDLALGSPYPLDAAFQAACVWGQAYRRVVAFPVAFDRRRVYRPTRRGQIYTVRVVPLEDQDEALSFDLYIYGRQGDLFEAVGGVRMRDVSGGRMRPPAWLRPPSKSQGPNLASQGEIRTVLIEHDTLAPFAHLALTPEETERHRGMGPRRAQSFLSARLALKRLSRRGASGRRMPPTEIQTVVPGSSRPACVAPASGPRSHCSVSHDDRFCIAVTAGRPVGVDVEPEGPRALRVCGLYMTDGEQERVRRSPLGAAAAALRIWSLKEAAAKAMGVDLAEAWQRVRTAKAGKHRSRVEIEGRGVYEAVHDTVDGHLFTLLQL